MAIFTDHLLAPCRLHRRAPGVSDGLGWRVGQLHLFHQLLQHLPPLAAGLPGNESGQRQVPPHQEAGEDLGEEMGSCDPECD